MNKKCSSGERRRRRRLEGVNGWSEYPRKDIFSLRKELKI